MCRLFPSQLVANNYLQKHANNYYSPGNYFLFDGFAFVNPMHQLGRFLGVLVKK